jgi:hypothetical protein
MSFASKIDSKGIFTSSIFYLVVGVVFLALLLLNDYPPHIGLLAIFSLGAAYGLLRKRSWSLWFVLVLFFSGTTFAAFMIYAILSQNLMYVVVLVVYLILTWVFTIYIAAKRDVLKA